MKKILALILATTMLLCICGCSSENDTSSDSVEVEYEEIVIDETGSSENTETAQSETQSATDNSNVDQPTQNSQSSAVSNNSSSLINIDYDTVVEVDICDDIIRGYLDASDAKNQFFWLKTYEGQKFDNQYLELDWYRDGSLTYTVYFSENADFSNAMTVEVNSNIIRTTTLIPGKTYYWKVTGTISSDVLGGGRIKVKDAPVRWVTVDGVGNVRDMGGWKTESGKTVKYGMIYRGRALGSLVNGEGAIYVTDNGLKAIKALGWKTELDLRYANQKFQTPGTGLNYEFIEHDGQFDNVLKNKPEVIKASYKRIFELLSDESNYPFYAHCNAGADRTGTFAFIANGLLGVSYEDLTRDFELTSFSASGKRWRADSENDIDGEMTVSGNYVAWGKLHDEMMNTYGTGDGKLSSAIENFLLNYIGVPQSQIDSFKSIMLQ